MKEGDRIAIVSPAGIVKPDNVFRAVHVLKEWGFEPYIGPNALNRHGIYAGTDAERLSDLRAALTDSNTRAIMCSRGGYGVVHLLEGLRDINLRAAPKWIIGFSDITALHALYASQGVASIHGHMTSHLASSGGDDDDSTALYDILTGHFMRYVLPPEEGNRPGRVRAPLLGGNLAVLAGLIATPYNLIQPGTIFFMEDVSEPVYKIERIMYQMRLSGMLDRLSGIVVGRFTKSNGDADGETMGEMLRRMLGSYDIPVAFDVPVGHVSHNLPLVEGAMTTLEVSDDGVVIDQSV